MGKGNGTVAKEEVINLVSRAFYKVIVIEVGITESTITDERNFPTEEEAERFRLENEVDGGSACDLVVKVG